MEHSKPFSIQTTNTTTKNKEVRMSYTKTHTSEPPFVTFPDSPDFDTEAWFATPELRSESKKNLLEIAVAWEGIILDIRHYEAPRRIAFGTSNHTEFNFPIDTGTENPEQADYFPLIEPTKNSFLLCFYPEMEGSIEENGERLSLLDLVNEGRAHCFDNSGRCYYALLPGVQFHFYSKGLEIKVRYVTAPQFSLKWSRHLGMNAPVLSFSIITHLLMAMLAILSTSPPAPAVHQPKVSTQKKKYKNNRVRPTSIYLKPVHFCIPVPNTKKQQSKYKKNRDLRESKTFRGSFGSTKAHLLGRCDKGNQKCLLVEKAKNRACYRQ